MQHRFTDRRSLLLAVLVVAIFLALAVIGPLFFSRPPQLGAQIAVSVLAFVTFGALAGFHVAPNSKFSGWITLAVFVIGYVVLFALRDGDFRPDQHWFIMSPLGYVAGALALGVPGGSKHGSSGSTTRNDALDVQCWSSTGEVEPPVQQPELLIEHLDGDRLTLVRLRRGARTLEIAGGLNGHLVAYYSENFRDDAAWWVYTPNKEAAGSGDHLMHIGGVQGYVPERLWCGVDQVQPLVTEFMTQGRIGVRDDVRWGNDGVMAGGTRPSLPG